MKRLLLFTLFLCGSFLPAKAQKETSNLQKFTNSFAKNFYPHYIDSFIREGSNFFIPSLFVIRINAKLSIDSIYFSDSAPDWQIKELDRVKSKLDIISLQKYAKQSNFQGNLIFPIILKSELTKGALKENDIHSVYYNLFRHKGKLLSGNVKFEDAIVITAAVQLID